MNEITWQCPQCGERHVEEFSECWSCGYQRGSGGDEQVRSEPEGVDPVRCPPCDLPLEYQGTRKFHEGSRAAPFLLGELGELFVNRMHFDVYLCPRCGRVEFFLDGVGEEFRPH